MSNIVKFDSTTVIDYHLEEEFKQIPESILMDFLPGEPKPDNVVMETWKKHFRGVRVPFAISKVFVARKDGHGKRIVVESFVLWKQRRV